MTRIPHSKKAALLMACVGVAAAVPAPARAEPPLRVRVLENSLVVPTSVLDNAIDVDRARQVTIRGAVGVRSSTAGGTSALRLAELMSIPPASVTSVGVQTLTGKGFTPEVSITGDELRSGFGGDPLCPSCQATFDHFLALDTVNFFRPLRTPDEDNDPDLIRPARRQSLYVRFTTTAPFIGSGLTLSDRTPRSDQTIQLTATPPAGAEVTWYFGDGTMATGTQVTKRYAPGNWPLAMVTHDGTGFGVESAVVPVKAPPSLDPSADRDSGLSGNVPTPSPRANPVGGAGGSNAGAGTGAGKGSPTGSANGATATAAPSAAGSAASPAPAVAATSAPAATPPPNATPEPTPTPAPAAAGTRPISGQLASSAPKPRSLAAAITAADALARAPTPKQDDAPGADGNPAPLVGSALSGILLLGLLASGTFTEVRRSRRAALPS